MLLCQISVLEELQALRRSDRIILSTLLVEKPSKYLALIRVTQDCAAGGLQLVGLDIPVDVLIYGSPLDRLPALLNSKGQDPEVMGCLDVIREYVPIPGSPYRLYLPSWLAETESET
jgi:hypothetical protein